MVGLRNMKLLLKPTKFELITVIKALISQEVLWILIIVKIIISCKS
jgi:hypothetical protein